MYNDDTSTPDGRTQTHSGHAHAKGVLATDANSGFWLVHSVPRFPKDDVGREAYSGITKNGKKFAQSFLCITVGVDQMAAVGTQLRLARPFIYESGGFGEELLHKLGHDFKALLDGEEVPSDSGSQTSVKVFSTMDGVELQSFSKSKYWGSDFYDQFVAPTLGSNMSVETWNNGRGTLPSYCSREQGEHGVHNVSNVTEVSISDSLTWGNEKDHSKWGVTDSADKHTACIGDINRQNGQRVRGGGTVCLTDESLWTAIHGMIKQADTCAAP
jgi:deoxyribonuclease-2